MPTLINTQRNRIPVNLVEQEFNFGYNSDLLVTGGSFTITNVNCTPAYNVLGNRPCLDLAGAGASTDGSQFQVANTGIRPYQGRQLVLRGTVWAEDATNFKIRMGFAATDTTIIASDPTDLISLDKPTGATAWYLRHIKASATASVIALPFSFASSGWYYWHLAILMSATAGAGQVKVGLGAYSNPGSEYTEYTYDIGANLPDTVDLGAFVAFLAGSANTSHCGFGPVSLKESLLAEAA